MHTLSAYVQQDDCMLATQTVRETIIMSALLRLSSSITYEEKLQRADDCISLFGLAKCQDTYIGVSLLLSCGGLFGLAQA